MSVRQPLPERAQMLLGKGLAVRVYGTVSQTELRLSLSSIKTFK